jgi:serine/threonine protein kinase
MERLAPPGVVPQSSACVACGTALSAERCDHCGAASRAGPYTVKRLVAQTPHSRVYVAEDEAGAQVALKELIYTLVPSAQELDAFERETKLLQSLQHPAIPRFVRGFTVGSGAHTRLYLAQELVSGESLARRVERGALSEDEVYGFAVQVLEVLDWLHHRTPPVVHRDVKPANVIVRPNGKVSLVDFGAARDVKGAQTYRSTLVGTIGYMPPEQLGGTVGPRSDLYALGATMVNLLTRRPPEEWVGPGLAVDVSRLQVSQTMRRVLEKLLAPRVEDRFADARAAIEAIRDPSRLVPATARRRRNLPLVFASFSLAIVCAMAAGALVLRGAPTRPQAAVVTPPVVEAPQPAPVRAPRTLGEQPVVNTTAFNWQLASWDFRKPGPWLLDMTGHQHSVPFPSSGYTVEFFGPVFDGTEDIEVPDAPDLAPTGPFNLHTMVGRFDGVAGTGKHFKAPVNADGSPKVEHLVTRGDPDGDFAYDLAVIGDRLRFTIRDDAGKEASVTGKMKIETSSISIYAMFDPAERKLTLLQLGNCKPLGQITTGVRPARVVKHGKVHLLRGYAGMVDALDLERGLQEISDPGGKDSCGLRGAKLDVKQ